MRYIDIRTSIKVNGGKDEFTTGLLILHAIANDRRFNTGGAGIRAALRIENALNDATKAPEPERETHVGIEEADWKLLCEALEDPQPMQGAPYPISPAMRLVPLIDSVTKAESARPAAAARPVAEVNGAAASAVS